MCRTEFVAWRFTIQALLVACGITIVAAFFPGDQPLSLIAKGWAISALAWIAAQSFALMIPGLLAGLLVLRWSPRLADSIVAASCFTIALVVVCDVMTYSWIAERFLSRKVLAIVGELPRGLAGHVPMSTWWYGGGLTIGFFVFAFSSRWLSRRLADRLSRREQRLSSSKALLVCCAVTIALATPAIWNLQTTRSAMHQHSGRFPLCAFSVGTTGGGVVSVGEQSSRAATSQISMDAMIQNLQRQRETVSVTVDVPGSLPDVVIVIIESMRSELVDPQAMPNLWRLAQKGMHCRRHFSAGNATNHGMFSLFNGVDATVYSMLSRQPPLLSRLFHEAGYEIGFFAGHNDWAKFRMDGFIQADHFDRFQIDQPDWLKSDRRATERAKAFLEAERSKRSPRLAVLYLYSTHADYHSYAQDQIFQPAADDRFLIPYSISSQPAVWNRYKNSAHCADRFLNAVLLDDRVVVVAGDHGESFLEDGVCGHGVRISKFQNMTPAVIYVPGGHARTIDAPTSHADLLPTMLAAAGVRVDDPSVFDGDDLHRISPDRMNERVIVTRDYLSNECGLVSQSLNQDAGLFAIHGEISMSGGSVRLLGAIDANGNETPMPEQAKRIYQRFVDEWDEKYGITR